jgi:hypothetical protein
MKSPDAAMDAKFNSKTHLRKQCFLAVRCALGFKRRKGYNRTLKILIARIQKTQNLTRMSNKKKWRKSSYKKIINIGFHLLILSAKSFKQISPD